MEDRERTLGAEAPGVGTQWAIGTRTRRVNAAVSILGALILTWGCAGTDAGEHADPESSGGEDYRRTGRIFAPGTISTGMNERDATLTPDGTEFYFTVWSGAFGTIMVSVRDETGWLKPRVAAFSGTHSDLEPFVAPDGSRLFFASTRPTELDSTGTDYNLWFVDRVGPGWGPAQLITELAENGGNEYFPSTTSTGELYFTAKRNGGAGGEDIWRALVDGDGYGTIEPVPGDVNTDRDEFNAYVASDGSYLIFSSWGRSDGLGGGDLYISFRNESGGFSEAFNMGPRVNSPSLDYSPYVSPDGSILYFSSRRSGLATPSGGWTYESLREALEAPGNGQGDIFFVDTSVLDSLRQLSMN